MMPVTRAGLFMQRAIAIFRYHEQYLMSELILEMCRERIVDGVGRFEDIIFDVRVDVFGNGTRLARLRKPFFKNVQSRMSKAVVGSTRCRNCRRGLFQDKGKVCGSCHSVHYCDVQCARVDWPLHKIECNKREGDFAAFSAEIDSIFKDFLYAPWKMSSYIGFVNEPDKSVNMSQRLALLQQAMKPLLVLCDPVLEECIIDTEPATI